MYEKYDESFETFRSNSLPRPSITKNKKQEKRKKEKIFAFTAKNRE